MTPTLKNSDWWRERFWRRWANSGYGWVHSSNGSPQGFSPTEANPGSLSASQPSNSANIVSFNSRAIYPAPDSLSSSLTFSRSLCDVLSTGPSPTDLPIPQQVILPKMAQLTIRDTHQVPWSYQVTPEPVVDEIGGMRRSGRCYTPEELESAGKAKRGKARTFLQMLCRIWWQ